MPFAFENFRGVVGDQLRLARGNHRVAVTGLALTLLTMIPSLSHQQVGGITYVEYPLICWLVMGVIRVSPAIPLNTRLARYIVEVARLGTAFEHLLANRLNTAACSASVARGRIKRLGMKLAVNSPDPFTALPPDLYSVIPPVPAAPPAFTYLATPPAAHNSTLEMFVGAGRTLQPLADAEPILQPRMSPPERLAGQGFDYFFTPALEQVQEAFPAAFRPLIDPIDVKLAC